MPVITSIKPQKKGKRVNVFLDGEFGFGLGLQTFIKEGLKVEQELSDAQIASIIKKGEFQDAYDKILMYAAIRPRSRKEYKLWLGKHKVHDSLHEEIYNRLTRLELLDDRKFAHWWVQQRQTFRPKSKGILYQELRLKGLDPDIINEVLSEENIDDKGSAKMMLSKKMYKWKDLEGYEKRRKIYAFLMQKGFSADIIREVIEEIDDD